MPYKSFFEYSEHHRLDSDRYLEFGRTEHFFDTNDQGAHGGRLDIWTAAADQYQHLISCPHLRSGMLMSTDLNTSGHRVKFTSSLILRWSHNDHCSIEYYSLWTPWSAISTPVCVYVTIIIIMNDLVWVLNSSCSQVHVDAMDVAGDNQVDIEQVWLPSSSVHYIDIYVHVHVHNLAVYRVW